MTNQHRRLALLLLLSAICCSDPRTESPRRDPASEPPAAQETKASLGAEADSHPGAGTMPAEAEVGKKVVTAAPASLASSSPVVSQKLAAGPAPQGSVDCTNRNGDLFILGGYGARTSDSKGPPGGRIDDLARDGFTVAGPYYPQTPDWLDGWMKDQLADVTRFGLCLAYSVVPRRTVAAFGPIGTKIGVEREEVAKASPEQLNAWVADVEAQVKKAVADSALNSRIAVWYIQPEEMRYWKRTEAELLRRLHETVKRNDPLGRPTMMYEPQRSQAARLKETAPYQDILAVGMYLHDGGHDHERIHIKYTMSQIVQAIEASGAKSTPMAVLEMWESAAKPFAFGEQNQLENYVRHDVYCALANGAKGIFVWSMGLRPGFRNYTDYYHAWGTVVHQLRGTGLPEAILHGTVVKGTDPAVMSGPREVKFVWGNVSQDYSPVSQRQWDYQSKRYVLLVNSSEEAVTIGVSGLPAGSFQNLLATDAAPVAGGATVNIAIPAIGAVLLRN